MTRAWASRTLAVVAFLAIVRVIWLAIAYFEGGRLGRYRLEAAWIAVVLVSILWLAVGGAFRSKPAELVPRGSLKGLAPLAVFVIASVVLYWPAIWIGLFSDDYSLLSMDGMRILRGSGWDYYRPVPLIAWQLLFPFGSAPALHLLNVMLHGANAWLAAGLTARLGHRQPLPVLIGFVFLTFPAAVEPVAWSSGVFDVAMVTCGLLYLRASLAERDRRTQLLWLVGALLSKETAVALPMAAASLRLGLGMSLRPLLASAAVTIGYVAVRLWSGLSMPHAQPAPARYLLKELISRPFASLSVPYTSAELASHPIVLGVFGVMLIAVLIWVYCARPHAGARPLASAAVVIIGVLPVWQIVAIGEHLDGSRYLYLPLVGWAMLLGDLVSHENAIRRWACATAVLIILALPGAWYTRAHLNRWQEAGRLRDAVLRSAVHVLSESHCSTGHFRNVPDSLQGVYIFRNGFSEALQGRAIAAGSLAPPACTYTWSADGFVRDR